MKGNSPSKRDPRWALRTGQKDGKVILMRVEQTARERWRGGKTVHRFEVKLPLTATNDLGLPSPEENLALQQIEGELAAAVESKGETLLVAALTREGARTLILYTSEIEEVRRQLEQLAQEHPERMLLTSDAPDPERQVYGQLVG